eukprot:TRINITY_DN67960_c4_g2_i1.p1 TRINITY_DN67960_c4_g2~~TRINITY_DN67960_c4_g2_i1.p1  ORF type:complete len:158 (-),score=23.64 TRINITY_DN67960_c4_g2_i1:159-572(-)
MKLLLMFFGVLVVVCMFDVSSAASANTKEHKSCRCTTTVYSDGRCMQVVTNSTTTTVKSAACVNTVAGDSEKINKDCTVAHVFKGRDCSGTVLYTMYADGKCHPAGASFYKATCSACQLATSGVLGFVAVCLFSLIN